MMLMTCMREEPIDRNCETYLHILCKFEIYKNAVWNYYSYKSTDGINKHFLFLDDDEECRQLQGTYQHAYSVKIGCRWRYRHRIKRNNFSALFHISKKFCNFLRICSKLVKLCKSNSLRKNNPCVKTINFIKKIYFILIRIYIAI